MYNDLLSGKDEKFSYGTIKIGGVTSSTQTAQELLIFHTVAVVERKTFS